MHRAANFLVGQRDNDPLNLPPMAEAHHIILVTGSLGSRRRLEPGIVAIGFQKQRGIRQCGAVIDERRVHEILGKLALLALRRTDRVNEPSTMIDGFSPLRLAGPAGGRHVGGMQNRRTPAAGGIFLFLGPVVGALYGIGRGEPILWMLYGFGLGAALAVVIWLVDKRRG